MKKQTCLLAAGIALAAVMILTGCPKEASNVEPDSRLVGGPWKNGDKTELSGLYKEFTIGEDYTFTAYINPPFIEAVAAAKAGSQGYITTDAAAIAAVKQNLSQQLPQGVTVDAYIASWEWKVTGTLTIDDGELYIMDNLEEKNDRYANPNDPTMGKANDIIGNGYNTQKVEIKFLSDTRFTFQSATGNTEVTNYFGGTYAKAAE